VARFVQDKRKQLKMADERAKLEVVSQKSDNNSSTKGAITNVS